MNTNAQKNQIVRINRKLAKQDCKLHTSRSWRTELSVGEYYVVDIYMNAVIQTHVDLDHLEVSCETEHDPGEGAPQIYPELLKAAEMAARI